MFELEIGISLGEPDHHMFSPGKFVVSAFRVFGDDSPVHLELTAPIRKWNYSVREGVQLLRRICIAGRLPVAVFQLPLRCRQASGEHRDGRDWSAARLAGALTHAGKIGSDEPVKRKPSTP